MKQRIVWIDVLKGVGILSIMFQHVTEHMNLLLYAVPLFFMVSGYLHKPVSDLKSFFVKNVRRMIVPYLCFFLLIAIKDVVLSDEPEAALAKYAKLLIWGGNHMKGELSVFWFINVLFISLQVFNYMRLKEVPAYVYLLLYLLSFFVGWHDINLPWNLQSIPLAVSYMYVGALFHQFHTPADIGNISSVKKCITGGVVVAGIICIPGIYLDIKYNDYGLPVVSYALSILVTVYLATLSAKLKPSWWITSFLVYCGKASLFLMFIHQAIRFRLLFIHNHYVVFALTVFISVLAYYICSKFRVGRILLCGER